MDKYENSLERIRLIKVTEDYDRVSLHVRISELDLLENTIKVAKKEHELLELYRESYGLLGTKVDTFKLLHLTMSIEELEEELKKMEETEQNEQVS